LCKTNAIGIEANEEKCHENVTKYQFIYTTHAERCQQKSTKKISFFEIKPMQANLGLAQPDFGYVF
jgi:hypothetical protein